MRCTRFLSGTLLFSKVLLGCFMLAGLAGCNSLKKVPENQSLLVKNKVKVSSGGTIDKNDLSSALAQEPNSKILGGRLKLSFYNWSKDEKDNWWNNKLRDIGEKPVIFDSTAIQSSAERILSMASAKGYFHPVLETEVTRKGREKRKVVVSYRLQLDEPYHIRHTQIDIQDDSLRPELADWEKEALVQPGMQYDVSLLDAERARISEKLQNNGYWAFNKDFLHYSIDSNLNSKQMDVILHVRKMVSNMVDSLTGEPILLHHKKYYLDQVYIIPLSRNQAQADTFRFDTVALPVVMRPLVYTYLVCYEFSHGLKYVALARGALAGMAESVYLNDGHTGGATATVLYDDCEILDWGVAALVRSFGAPNHPNEDYSRAPAGTYMLNLEVRLTNGEFKSFDFDVSVDGWGEYVDIELPLN